MMKVLYVLWAILAGICIGFIALLSLPFVMLYGATKMLITMAKSLK